jgi:CheY-like chemotaxis protein
VDLAGNGREALQKLSASEADCPWRVVLMDLQMPEMDGYTAARAIRAQPRFEQLPILAMTAHLLREEQQSCRECGMDGFLAKPIDPDAWFAVLGRWLPLQGQPGAPATGPVLRVGGVNTEAGLRRSSGNAVLYRRLLLDFGSRCAALGTELASLKPPRLAFLAHSLRGEAANLGIEDLAAQLTRLEREPHDQQLVAGVSALLQSLGASLPAQVEVNPGPAGAGDHAAQAAEAAHQLRHDLQHSLGAAIESLEHLLQAAPSLVATGEMKHLQNLVHQFDFAPALVELERLMPLLGPSDPGEPQA